MTRRPRSDLLLSTCERKRVFDSVGEALAIIPLMPPTDRVGLQAYTCFECGLIHLGHRRS